VLNQLLEQVSRVVLNDAANVMLAEKGSRVRIARWRGYERFCKEEEISMDAPDTAHRRRP